MPVIPALGNPRQKNGQSRPAWAISQDLVSGKKGRKNRNKTRIGYVMFRVG
jgi:hypothetical protein